MTVAVPVARPDVYLDVACPCMAVDGYFCVEKVGTGISVEPSRIENSDAPSVNRGQIVLDPQSVLPYILHQALHAQI